MRHGPYYKIKALRMRARDLTRARRRRRTTCSWSAAASTASPSPTRPPAAACASRSSKRGDFGSGASFNHQKTAHGGLRSLRSGNLRRARESPSASGARWRASPRGSSARSLPRRHLSIGRRKSRLALRGGIQARRAGSAGDRNDGVEPELHLPAPRLVSKAATLRLFPGINARQADRRRAVVRLPDGREPTD